jgi:hypothetical protein
VEYLFWAAILVRHTVVAFGRCFVGAQEHYDQAIRRIGDHWAVRPWK